jgi:putative hemolysin
VASVAIFKPYAPTIAVGVVVVVLTFFSLVLGELLPKRTGLNHPSNRKKKVSDTYEICIHYDCAIYMVINTFYNFLLNVLPNKAYSGW